MRPHNKNNKRKEGERETDRERGQERVMLKTFVHALLLKLAPHLQITMTTFAKPVRLIHFSIS